MAYDPPCTSRTGVDTVRARDLPDTASARGTQVSNLGTYRSSGSETLDILGVLGSYETLLLERLHLNILIKDMRADEQEASVGFLGTWNFVYGWR